MREEYTEPEFETKRVGEIPTVVAVRARRGRAMRGHGTLEAIGIEISARDRPAVARQQARDRSVVARHTRVDRVAEIAFPGPLPHVLGQYTAHRLTQNRARHAVAVLDCAGHREEQRDEIAIEERKRVILTVHRR